jgi:hypothetical protein
LLLPGIDDMLVLCHLRMLVHERQFFHEWITRNPLLHPTHCTSELELTRIGQRHYIRRTVDTSSWAILTRSDTFLSHGRCSLAAIHDETINQTSSISEARQSSPQQRANDSFKFALLFVISALVTFFGITVLDAHAAR